jgi:6-phosphogluconolactonase
MKPGNRRPISDLQPKGCTIMHRFIAIPGLIAVLLASMATSPTSAQDAPDRLRVYIGTYTGPKSKGIYLLEMDLKSGKLESKGLAGESANPSFLAIHPGRKYLYAVGETGSFDGKKTGSVAAFAIDAATGKLTLLNQQPSAGAAPCHIVVDKEGKNVLVANYSGGSVAVLPIAADGKLAEPSSVIQHQGSSVNKGRQSGPHAHSINLDSANRFAFAADLGLDKVLIYQYDADKGKLTPHTTPFAAVPPGSGPRHFAFHPSGRFAYVINEMLCTVTAFSHDSGEGALKEVQTITTLPVELKGGYSTAEVQVHPSGKFLYGSNRGHNSIAIFSIDSTTGKLTVVGHEPTQGSTPRNFGIDPTGAYLLAANQGSGNVVVFRIDPETGRLKATGQVAEVPSPVCVRFMPVPK